MAERQRELTEADVARIAGEVRTWGRWGSEDERGALNYITPAKRAAASALARDGAVLNCALSLAVQPAVDNPTPVQHHLIRGADAAPPGAAFAGSADYFAIAPHGLANTHLDALCHVFADGKMYNGFDARDVRSDGAHHNSIMAGADGIVSRGVLLDIPALRGVDWLELGERVSAADLAAAEEREGVRVEEGDILLVSTGRYARRDANGPWNPRADGLAGLYADCIPWLHARRIALLGGDGISDVMPSGVEGWRLPIHQIVIVSMGVQLIDNMDLGPLAAACRERGRWEFLFVVAPLRLERGTASPVNPIALF